MSYDRSVELKLGRDQNRLDPPKAYRRRLSIKSFLKVTVPVVAVTFVVTVLLWYFLRLHWWYVLIVIAVVTVSAITIYREYYKWSRNHLACNPDDGVLHIEDHSHPLILLQINGSSDDRIPLDEAELDTPTLGFLDRWVFRCAPLIAGDRTIKDVKHVEELLAIHKYYESMKKESINIGKDQVSVQSAILETLESMGRDLAEVVRFLASIGFVDAQPLPPRRQVSLVRRRPADEGPEPDEPDDPDEAPLEE